MKYPRLLIALAMVLGFTALASAQAINPPAIRFDHAPGDFALVDGYEVGYFLTAATEPHTVVLVAKADIAPFGQASPTLNTYGMALPRPLFANGVTSKIRAVYTTADAQQARTPWSASATVPFVLSPTTPASPRLP